MKITLTPVKNTGALHGLSLQHRIPLLVSLLLLVVVTCFVSISYWSIKNIEAASGKQRLAALATQVSLMLEESIDDFVRNTKNVAEQTALQQHLVHLSDKTANAAKPILNAFAGPGMHEYALLVNQKLEPVLLSVKNHPSGIDPVAPVMPPINDPSLVATNIYRIKDSIYFAVLAPVSAKGLTLGYLIRCRKVRIENNVLKQYASLAGSGISIIVGNADGSLWTNLSQILPYRLPVSATTSGKAYEYRQTVDDQPIVGAFERIKHTPWIVAIEASRSLAFAGSSRYLQWMILIASLMIVVATGIAWYMGRNIARPLKELITSVQAMGSGSKNIHVPVLRTDEVGELARSFNAMTLQVAAANSTVQKEMEASTALNEQLRRLSAHLSSVREEERASIARDLHDHMGQVLTGFKMDLHQLKKQLPGAINPVANDKIKNMEAGLDEGVKFVRKLSSELRGGPLEDFGLAAAIQWYADLFKERYDLAVKVMAPPSDIRLPLPISTAVFRIFQESLTNIARHAAATEVEVELSKEPSQIRLRIRDNGKGFNTGKNGSGKTLGILGMQERALMIGARLCLHSSPGEGCIVELFVPLPELQSQPLTVA